MPLVFYALLATLFGGLCGLLPAVHIYNVVGLVVVSGWLQSVLTAEQFAFVGLGLVVGYAFTSTLPALFLGTPDDTTVTFLLPAQRYVLEGRGPEAVWLSGLGGLGGVAVILLLAPVASEILPPLRALTQPHLAWLLGVIIIFMLLSEWPRGQSHGTPWQRWWGTWRSLLAGLVTFVLAGVLGLVLTYRSPVPVTMAFQNLLPAFVGLFALPALLWQVVWPGRVPAQHWPRTLDAAPGHLGRGVAAGALGGLFAAFFPIVTGGIGGFLAGHATAQRDARIFVVGQGCNKVMYYVGAYWLFFVPNLHLSRGGLAAMVSPLYTAVTPQTHVEFLGALALSAGVAFLLLLGLGWLLARLAPRVPQRWLALAIGLLLLGIVATMTGMGGLAVASVATGIGTLPLLWETRRMHCLGVLLLPVTLNLFGLSDSVARWLGLL